MTSKKNIHKIFILQKNIYFSENPQNIEIQNFERKKKMNRAYVCMQISEYSPSAQTTQTSIPRGYNSFHALLY